MSNYFDQDFFKFLLGFTAILAFSLIVILVAKSYQNSQNNTQTANVIQAVTKSSKTTYTTGKIESVQ